MRTITAADVARFRAQLADEPTAATLEALQLVRRLNLQGAAERTLTARRAAVAAGAAL